MSASLQAEEKAESRLLLGVVIEGHQRTAILAASSLTCGGSTDFISLCGSQGGDVPGNFWQSCGERMMTVCFILNLAYMGVIAVFIGDQMALPVCLQEPNY
jgi:hypothetical protein